MEIARRLFLVGLLALAALGCGKEEADGPAPGPLAGGNEAASTNGPANAPETAPAGEASGNLLSQEELDGIGKVAAPHKLALIVKTRNNPFFDPMIKAAEAEARALGVQLEVQAPAQETDKERQFAMVQDVTAKGVDAILIARPTRRASSPP
jgi:ABC-type sugar transport system substrate-binding protein